MKSSRFIFLLLRERNLVLVFFCEVSGTAAPDTTLYPFQLLKSPHPDLSIKARDKLVWLLGCPDDLLSGHDSLFCLLMFRLQRNRLNTSGPNNYNQEDIWFQFWNSFLENLGTESNFIFGFKKSRLIGTRQQEDLKISYARGPRLFEWVNLKTFINFCQFLAKWDSFLIVSILLYIGNTCQVSINHVT